MVFVVQHVDQNSRDDLPRQTKSVCQPAASAFLPAFGKFFPKIIHFFLRLAVNNKRDGLGEFEHRTAVEPHESLPLKLEFNRHDRSFWPAGFFGCFFAIAGNSSDLGIFENGGVKLHRLLGVVIEPQKWSDFLHIILPLLVVAGTARISEPRNPFGPTVARLMSTHLLAD